LTGVDGLEEEDVNQVIFSLSTGVLQFQPSHLAVIPVRNDAPLASPEIIGFEVKDAVPVIDVRKTLRTLAPEDETSTSHRNSAPPSPGKTVISDFKDPTNLAGEVQAV
jgi:hypothetical protein